MSDRVKTITPEHARQALLLLAGLKTLRQFQLDNDLTTSSCYSFFFRAVRHAYRSGVIKITM